MLIIFDLKTDNWSSGQYTGPNEYIHDFTLDISHQYIPDCISILGTIILTAGTFGFEQVMSTCCCFFARSPSSANEDRETYFPDGMAWQVRKHRREHVAFGVLTRKISSAVKQAVAKKI